MSTHHNRQEFSWKQRQLYRNNKVVAELVASDQLLSNPPIQLYKIKFTNRDLSADHYNESRAKDNAITLLLSELDSQETNTEAPLVRLNRK